MKAIKIRLLATMFTLAAVTMSTTSPVSAQRRSTERGRSSAKVENSRSQAVERKSTLKSNQSSQRSTQRPSARSSREVQRHQPTKSATNRSRRETATINRNNSAPNYRQPANESGRNRNTPNYSKQPSSSSRDRSDYATSGNSRGNYDTRRPDSRTNKVTSSRSRNDNRYDDKRYTPTRDFRGSKKYWDKNRRPSKMNYNRANRKFYKNYNYRTYNHWDRKWEHYRWNRTSWVDYYAGYNRYSYRYHPYYYHHNYYGHVISRFNYQPQVFVYNNNEYYNFDGNFFMYRPGIGYILVDIPLGMVFDYLPNSYEQVNINGYLYFRVGNLFFEHNGFGFELVHFPGRYFG